LLNTGAPPLTEAYGEAVALFIAGFRHLFGANGGNSGKVPPNG
jgi:hypothetical protein